jgi:hypothetical protein
VGPGEVCSHLQAFYRKLSVLEHQGSAPVLRPSKVTFGRLGRK